MFRPVVQNFRLVLFCGEEINTLPVGPVEVSTVWYAQARLAFSTLGVKVWSTSVNEMHTVLSRVMEKTSEYPMATAEENMKAHMERALRRQKIEREHFKALRLVFAAGVKAASERSSSSNSSDTDVSVSD